MGEKYAKMDQVTFVEDTILNKWLETNSQNYAKWVFLRNVLQLIFYNFLPKNVKIWLLG